MNEWREGGECDERDGQGWKGENKGREREGGGMKEWEGIKEGRRMRELRTRGRGR